MSTAQSGERLSHFPVSFFAVVMGLSGLTLATERLEKTLGVEHFYSLGLVIAAVAAFVVIAAFYLTKATRYWSAVVAEWHHPVRLSFFPAISISLLLLATAIVPFSKSAALAMWSVGATLHIIATLSVVSAWIGHRSFETPHMNPAWFIPAVGNVIVPITGMSLGFVEVSWFFFSVGMVFWVVLLTLVFNRLIFHNPLPERLYPTLVILVAPPAVGFVAYMHLNGGALDGFARILYYAGVLFLLVVAVQIQRFSRLPYALSWWAYSFPLAAITIATLLYAEKIGSDAFRMFGFVLYAVLVAVIAILILRTIKAIGAKQICVPE
ncbi:MAG: C4-dicarboxylate ABC transporter [Hyphomicrobiales bacterium]|nr:MAG: C4-dicarboxylate ABC transporter [Hyphomicrobiales bacterium]